MNLVLTLARVLRLYAIALWVGGIVFFIVVAAIAFGNLPSTHEAGIVVRHSLIAIHDIGLCAGTLCLIFTALLVAVGERTKTHAVELLLVVVMLGLTAYSQFSIIPQMERDRVSLQQQYGAEVDATPKTDAAHADFDRLHELSTKVESVVLLCGLTVLALTALQSEDHRP